MGSVFFIEVLGKTGKWYSPRDKFLSAQFSSFKDVNSVALSLHRLRKKTVRIVRFDMSARRPESMFKVLYTYDNNCMY